MKSTSTRATHPTIAHPRFIAPSVIYHKRFIAIPVGASFSAPTSPCISIPPLIPIIMLLLLLSLLLTPAFSINTRTTTGNTLVALADMVSPLLAHSRLQGSIDAQQHIELSIGLRPRLHFSPSIQNTSDTASTYQQFQYYMAAFSPAESTYQALARFLQAAGFTLTQIYNHRLLLDFSGTIAQAEQTFHVTIRSYVDPSSRHYYANADNPLLPAQFADQVIAINGLDDAPHWHSSLARSPHATSPPEHKPIPLCPGHNQQYMLPDQFAAAYNLDGLYRAHYQGEGQTLALFELSPFTSSDITTYTACFGHSHTPIQTIQMSNNLAHDDGVMEVEMDAELILSTAPRLGKLEIYETGNDVTSYLSQWARILQDAPPVVSTSWGLCEQTLNASLIKEENTLFTLAAAQGESIFASTGDTGSAGCFGDAHSTSNELGVDDPSSQPFVTSVGGTSLSLKGLSKYGSETVWNTSRKSQASYNGASGGGISHYWTLPAWQNTSGVHNAYSSGKPCGAASNAICRETPDVSLNADTDHGYLMYCSAQATTRCSNTNPWNVVGGTSVSTPLWAVLASLSNEMSQQQKGPRLGFLNLLLYQIASDPHKYHACFHDITTGNNDYNGLNHGLYPASKDYDLTTGLGSYDAYNLARNLVTQAKLRTNS